MCCPLAVAGCAREPGAGGNQVDVNAAAVRAESDIANYTGVPSSTRDDRQPPRVAAIYRCKDGATLHVAFDNLADDAEIRVGDSEAVTLKGMRPASGIWYAGGGYTLRGKGDEAMFTQPKRRGVDCRAA